MWVLLRWTECGRDIDPFIQYVISTVWQAAWVLGIQ